ncbi:outer membrane protein [Luteolibacter marinus]|uniref:outer membrane protein n=1 Tax=Luteolibacter marinus TaxID=2776705 RepID=UPI0018690E4E|nr:outer membrane beta-barrel protein [Luteolibacter marinus]
MKTNTTSRALAAALLFPAALMAGEAEMTNTTIYSEPAPTQHQGWFLGGGADYMFDAGDVFYNGHLGYNFGNGSSLFLESGWLGEEETVFPFLQADVDIIPVTLNFKQEFMFNERFGFYAGAGAGAANVDVAAGLVNEDDWVLSAQAFAGVVYNVTPNFELYTGVRYLWMDDVDIAGANLGKFDGLGVGAGLRFNF